MGAVTGMLRKFYKPIEKQIGKRVIIVCDLVNKSKSVIAYAFSGKILGPYIASTPADENENLSILFKPD